MSSQKERLDEIVSLKQFAIDHGDAYKEAVAKYSEDFGTVKSAINKYATARTSDKLDKLEEETSDIEKLLGVS